MKRSLLALLALSSALCCAPSAAAQRPLYGGTLRMDIQAAITSLEPASSPGMADGDGLFRLQDLIYDRLVRLDRHGQPQPSLAISWEHNKANTQWRFQLRSGVKWHDGSPLIPQQLLASLQEAAIGPHLQLSADALIVNLDKPSTELPVLFATDPDLFIRRKDLPATPSVGSGPFRLIEWHPGSRAVLQANEDYWGGRPYLDNIDILMGRSSRDQLLDFELDKADLVQLDPAEAHRLQQEGKRVWASAPIDLIWLQFDISKPKVQDSRLREAMAFAIDREAIHKVILQNYGEATASLFPQWLSGYSFLFAVAPNLEQAHKRLMETPKPPPLKLGYDPADLLLRQVAERVAVNVRDIGVFLDPTPVGPNSKSAPDEINVRILRSRIRGPALADAIIEVARSSSFNVDPSSAPEDVYRAEQQFVSDYARVPLIFAPVLAGIGPRLKGWAATQWDDWHLEDVWLGPGN